MPYKVNVFCARRSVFFFILFIIWKLTFLLRAFCPWEENDSQVFLASKWHYLLLSFIMFYSSALVAERRKQSGNLRGCSEDEISSPSSGQQVIWWKRNPQRVLAHSPVQITAIFIACGKAMFHLRFTESCSVVLWVNTFGRVGKPAPYLAPAGGRSSFLQGWLWDIGGVQMFWKQLYIKSEPASLLLSFCFRTIHAPRFHEFRHSLCIYTRNRDSGVST